MDSHEIEILLVEDNPHDAEMTKDALQVHNFTNNVILLEDGEQALDYMFATGIYSGRDTAVTPKLILLDLKLPKVSGLEVLKRLKSDARTKQIPVVVLSSSKEGKDVINSYKLGANSYVVKPGDIIEFSEVVSQISQYWLLLNEHPVS